MKKRIVVYYSFEGHTQEKAAEIAEKLQADLLPLKPKKDIPRKGIGKFLAGGMQALAEKCVGIEELSLDPSQYDEIILGTPVWAGRCTPAVNTFLQTPGVCEKVTAVFTLSGGGDNKSCIDNLKKRLPSLKYTASLCDDRGSCAEENEEKTARFLEELEPDR